MIPQSIFITSCLVILISIFFTCEASESTIGFTVDLIHRDSPHSPLYNPSLSPSQRLGNAIQRSHNRLHHFNTLCNKRSPVAEVSSSGVEYLMSYLIGTPPVPSLGTIDTGSSVSWTQCAPCTHCIKQKLPLFIPKKSRTYETVPCNSSYCQSIFYTSCDRSKKKCLYSVSYADRSTTNGDLATDTLTLGSTTGETISFPNFVFGCGFNSTGEYGGIESGIIGFGRGKHSLISQLGSSIQGKFAYCFVPSNSNSTNTSKVHFGDNAVVSGKGVVTIPLVNKLFLQAMYVATLEGISVGNKRLDISDNPGSGFSNNSRPVHGGDIIIDSGTTLTYLPTDLYNRVKRTLKRVVKLKRVRHPTGDFELCWFTKTDDRIPRITVHFKGADVILNTENAFHRENRKTLCFSFATMNDTDIAIYGNWAQTNFLVGYDVEKMTVSFQPKDCTNY